MFEPLLVSQKCLDVGHREEVFEVAVVRRGLLVLPRTEKKDCGGARSTFFVIQDRFVSILVTKHSMKFLVKVLN